jgi:hypothetical protein
MEPELYNLDTDPAERFNVAAAHPDIVQQLRARMQTFDGELKSASPAPSSYVERVPSRD